MADCNATLTTATVEPCPVHCVSSGHLKGHVMWTKHHVTLHTLTCVDEQPPGDRHTSHCNMPSIDDPDAIEWGDDSPGAKPHVEPEVLVTDEEVDAARKAFADVSYGLGRHKGDPAMRAALEAAAKIRKQQEADR